jgi:hypothetical protein
VVCLAAVTGFFDRPQREWFILAGLLALTWFRQVPCPRSLVPVVATLATASMWIYISHFRLWRPLDSLVPRGLAYLLTLLAGVAVWVSAEQVTRAARRAVRAGRRRAPVDPTIVVSSPARSRVTPQGAQVTMGAFTATSIQAILAEETP